jgi:hypothetical protein
MVEEEETSSSQDPSHPPQATARVYSLVEGEGEANKSWDPSRPKQHPEYIL